MSRIGKTPVAIPSGVKASIDGQKIVASGPKGELEVILVDEVSAEMTDDGIKVVPADMSKRSRSMWGMSRTLVQNIVTGVSDGFEKKLELVGVGYRAQAQGSKLNLTLGFSHPVIYQVPNGVTVETPTQTEVVVKGSDRQKVGQVSAEIRAYRPPEPYKGKGIRYADEHVRRKEAKKK